MKNTSLDVRMKDFYEVRNRRYLTRRTPVIIRIDGKAFHTYTKKLNRPFDEGLIEDMQLTTKYLCENIQGCKFGYTQSDEISLLVTDYDTLRTEAWFDYCQNKMESIGASMATSEFNRLRILRELNYQLYFNYNCGSDEKPDIRINELNYLERFMPNMANFDARSFNIPKEDVCNYFVWRQGDASKNSISMLAQSLYSHTELQGKHGGEMQEMCFQKGHNWNNLPTSQKRGTSVYKVQSEKELTGKVKFETLNPENRWLDSEGQYGVYSNEWKIDTETPIFSQNRELIENLI